MSLVVENAELAGVKLPMTYEEFMEWHTGEHHYEWVEGYPERISPVGLAINRSSPFYRAHQWICEAQESWRPIAGSVSNASAL